MTRHHDVEESTIGDSHPIPSGAVAALFAASAVLTIGGSLAIRHVEMGKGAQALLALAPLPFLAGLAFAWRRMIDGLDEFERMLRMQACVTALALGAFIMLAVTQLQLAGVGGPEDWNLVWPATFASFLWAYHAKAASFRH